MNAPPVLSELVSRFAFYFVSNAHSFPFCFSFPDWRDLTLFYPCLTNSPNSFSTKWFQKMPKTRCYCAILEQRETMISVSHFLWPIRLTRFPPNSSRKCQWGKITALFMSEGKLWTSAELLSLVLFLISWLTRLDTFLSSSDQSG